MPQGPLTAAVALTTSQTAALLHEDAKGNLLVSGLPALTALDLTATTLLKTGVGRVGTLSLVAPGTVAGGVYDCLTTAQVNVTNQICAIPVLSTTQITAFKVDMPYTKGLVVAPGTGQGVSINYE